MRSSDWSSDVCSSDLLFVAAAHAVEKGAEGGLAGLAAALVDVMHHVVGQIAEEPLGILHVERVVIGLDQAGGGSMRHGPRTPVTQGTIRLPLHSLRQPRLDRKSTRLNSRH